MQASNNITRGSIAVVCLAGLLFVGGCAWQPKEQPGATTRAAAAEERLGTLQLQLDDAIQRRDAFKLEVQQARADATAARAKAQSAQDDLKKAQDAITANAAQLQQTRELLNKANSELQTARTAVVAGEQAGAELKATKTKLQEAEQKNADLQRDVTNLRTRIVGLEKQLDVLTNDNADLAKKLDEATKPTTSKPTPTPSPSTSHK